MVARLAAYGDRELDRQLFVVSHWQDDLMSFNRNRPFHQLNLNDLSVFALVTPGAPDVAAWSYAVLLAVPVVATLISLITSRVTLIRMLRNVR